MAWRERGKAEATQGMKGRKGATRTTTAKATAATNEEQRRDSDQEYQKVEGQNRAGGNVMVPCGPGGDERLLKGAWPWLDRAAFWNSSIVAA